MMEKAKNSDYAFVSVSMSEVLTCDKEMCDECATSIYSEIDFCPDCIRKIKASVNGR